MSQSLDFRITASDQASRVVTAVQKKVQDFGKDIGRSITNVLGPMAVLTYAFSKVSSMIDEAKQKSKEAFDWGAGLTSQAAALGVTAEELQRLQKVADDTGLPLERVAKAMKEANRVLAEARSGNKESVESLRQLGVKVEDLEKTSPEEVIGKLGRAMASIESPIDKATAAFAVFGEEGKKLVETLERLRDITKIGPVEGLSDEESEQLRLLEKANREKANRERLDKARQQVTESFLENDPAGKAIVLGAQRKALESAGPYGAGAAGNVSAATLKNSPEFQAIVQRILKARADAIREANKPTPGESATGRGLVDLGRQRAEKPERPKKPEKPEKPEVFGSDVTVSSLRAIGGGLIGEVAGGVDYNQIQIDLQRQMARYLEEISRNIKPPSDPTKQPDGSLRPGPLNGSSRIGMA
jgi:hypothetical protein